MRRMLLPLVLLLSTQAAGASYLYRMTMVRAAPGRLLELIELYKEQMPAYEAAGDERPLWMRHTQGDQWDLLLIFPMESFSSYYAEERQSRRQRAMPKGLSERLQQLTALKEDILVEGPPLEQLKAAHSQAGFFHSEMFVALPGKLETLLEERAMENAFVQAVGRPANFTFTRVEGAAWDVVSLGFYRDLAHFAESRKVSPQQQDAAAKAAGFEDAKHVSPYMRSLILYHRDTMGVVLK